MGKLKDKKEVQKTSEELLRDSVVDGYTRHHGTPLTRREMLASGVIPFAASFAMPSWLQMFAKAGVAQAEDLICAKAGSTLPAFIQIKANGGYAAGMNFVANAAGGQMVDDFSKYGGGTAANLPVVTEFGNKAQFYAQSGFLAGLRAVVLPETLAKICSHSGNLFWNLKTEMVPTTTASNGICKSFRICSPNAALR